MPSVILLFCDGVGLGEDDPGNNPFARARSPYLPFYQSEFREDLPYDGILIPTRADMDTPGLPQSATGQTAILCGVRSTEALGRHVPGFPTPTLRKIIDSESLFIDLRDRGATAVFANALSKAYFERLGERISATTRALLAGDYPPLMLDDLRAENAVTHDLTNQFLRGMGLDLPIFSIEKSIGILAGMTRQYDFTLFEFILSDRVGHEGDDAKADEVVERMHQMLDLLLPQVDLNETTVVLTSDHGNLEDISVATHTRNLVPTMVWGPGRAHFRENVSRLEEIAPAILTTLDKSS